MPAVTRAYRMMVTVYIEGEPEVLPPALEVAEITATLVQDPDDHDFAVSVSVFETEDYPVLPEDRFAPETKHYDDFLKET
jgi:hypothetical protein